MATNKIPLFICPVCIHASHEFCTIRADVTVAQEMCEKFEWNGQAAWIHYADCPDCEGGGMLQQDKYGASCAISGCKFTQNYIVRQKTDIE